MPRSTYASFSNNRVISPAFFWIDRVTTPAYQSRLGTALLGDSQELLAKTPDNSVNLIFTSPPFALRRKKQYGNVSAEEYVDWFLKFAHAFYRVLTPDGSLVVDIGGSWTPGEPTKSLYHYRLLLALVDHVGFHLAQEIFWYNPARLPTPVQWVCRDRVRLKDAVNNIWWLSKTPRPKANNRRVLTEYKSSHKELIATGKYNTGRRPSEHVISKKFAINNGGAIPPNFIDESILHSLLPNPPAETPKLGFGVGEEIYEGDAPENLIRGANTASSDPYLKGCRAIGAVLHPARIAPAVPEFFIRFLTEPGDLVLDPFAGSNVTGAVAEQNGRHWLAIEINPDYLFASQTRFTNDVKALKRTERHFTRLAKESGTVFQKPILSSSNVGNASTIALESVAGEGAEQLRAGEVGQ